MARGRSMKRSPDSPSSVACGATFPTQGEGYHGLSVKYRDSIDLL